MSSGTDNAMARFLYAILEQKNMRDVSDAPNRNPKEIHVEISDLSSDRLE